MHLLPQPRRYSALLARGACLAWALFAAAGGNRVVAQPPIAGVSAAEKLLFETDHLARTRLPAVLTYAFHSHGADAPAFKDQVRLDLARHHGKVQATLQFLSGRHKHDTAPLEDAHGNPVLLGFLERDIAEMKRLTGGSTAYFRKRLRMALAEGARVSPQSITYQGKPLPAQAVRIQPYLNDPMHARFEQYVAKTYTFIFSEQVPGGIYQLRSSLTRQGSDAPAIDETLTLAGIAHPRR